MEIGDIKEFRQGQMSKLERCKKEEERIKKGIYRMHVMIEDQCSETLDKEREKQQQTKAVDTEENASESKQKKTAKPDLNAEMEKMLAAVSKNSGVARVML